MKNFVPAIKKAYQDGLLKDTDTIVTIHDKWCCVGRVIFFEITDEVPNWKTFKANLEMQFLEDCQGLTIKDFFIGHRDEIERIVYVGV